MECGTHFEFDTCMLEKVTPNMSCEYRVAVTDDGLWEPMQTNNVVEESSCHRRCCVWVTKCDDMGKFREPIHHCQDHTFTMYTRESLDEVHRYVRPYLMWHIQGLQQASWV